MRRKQPAIKKASRKRGKSSIAPAGLQAMIVEATVDAHDEEEQVMGFFSVLEENIAFPFETVVLGVPVTVKGLKQISGGQIAAICTRGGTRQAIPIEELPLPSPSPAGAEWIEAYREWMRWR